MAVATQICADGGVAETAVFDVTQAAATRAAIDMLVAAGPIHALVHNAGIHADAPLAGMALVQWHQVIDVSLNGSFHTL